MKVYIPLNEKGVNELNSWHWDSHRDNIQL